MKNPRIELKILSIVVLAMAGFSLVMMCINAFTGGLTVTELPADAANLGLTKEAYQIVAYVIFGLTISFLLPNVFVGLRGIKMANSPEKTKGHIVWAVILFALAVVSVFSHIPQSISALTFDNIWTLVDKVIEVLLFGAYIYYAILVYREA